MTCNIASFKFAKTFNRIINRDNFYEEVVLVSVVVKDPYTLNGSRKAFPFNVLWLNIYAPIKRIEKILHLVGFVLSISDTLKGYFKKSQ